MKIISDRITAFLMRPDVRAIIKTLSVGDRKLVRDTPKDRLIRFHRGWGMGLRNAFRAGRYRWLALYGNGVIEKSGEQLSFDALSSVAIDLIWEKLQENKD
jgi:hypothetical protein